MSFSPGPPLWSMVYVCSMPAPYCFGHFDYCVSVAHSHLTLSNPTACCPQVSSIHGILQVRILERAAISFSRGASQPRGWTQVSYITGRFFTVWATREAWSLQRYYTFWYWEVSCRQFHSFLGLLELIEVFWGFIQILELLFLFLWKMSLTFW